MQNFCGKCGTKLSTELKFCTNCGAPIQTNIETQKVDAPKETSVKEETKVEKDVSTEKNPQILIHIP